jgi:FAD:protein FMN transferase
MIWIVFFIFSAFLSGCSSSKDASLGTTEFLGTAMTMDYRLIVGKTLTQTEIDLLSLSIQNVFYEVNDLYNNWNPDSELSSINRQLAGVKIPLSAKLEAFLQEVDQVVALTQGKFDPTIAPLLDLWKKKLSSGHTPSEEEIRIVKPAIGWKNVHIENGFLWKDHDKTALDLGGIAKGYCVDLLVEKMNSQGFINVFVEWGGEIRASGKHPSGRPWTIFVSRLGNSAPDDAVAILPLNDEAIATSGDYMQYWNIRDEASEDGLETTFFHIIDPQTLRPLISTNASIASASVKTSTCALADGLATAAMMFASLSEAEAWIAHIKQKLPQAEFWLQIKGEAQPPLKRPLAFAR